MTHGQDSIFIHDLWIITVQISCKAADPFFSRAVEIISSGQVYFWLVTCPEQVPYIPLNNWTSGNCHWSGIVVISIFCFICPGQDLDLESKVNHVNITTFPLHMWMFKIYIQCIF